MKLKNTITTLLIAGMATLAANGATNIIWDSPENFRDIKYFDSDSEKSRSIVMKDLEKYFIREANRVLTPGHSLTIKVTDVDLAGEFEPWRFHLDDTRIIKSVYPARLAFDYAVTAEDGTVVAEGSELLRDNLHIAPMHLRNEEHPYVKDLFRTWVRKMARNHIS